MKITPKVLLASSPRQELTVQSPSLGECNLPPLGSVISFPWAVRSPSLGKCDLLPLGSVISFPWGVRSPSMGSAISFPWGVRSASLGVENITAVHEPHSNCENSIVRSSTIHNECMHVWVALLNLILPGEQQI